MNNPDLSRWQRAVNWCAPYYRLWQREKAQHSDTRKELADTSVDLAVTLDELGGTKAHFDHDGRAERDQARALAAAVVSEREWSTQDEALIADGFGAWMFGEGPA